MTVTLTANSDSMTISLSTLIPELADGFEGRRSIYRARRSLRDMHAHPRDIFRALKLPVGANRIGMGQTGKAGHNRKLTRYVTSGKKQNRIVPEVIDLPGSETRPGLGR